MPHARLALLVVAVLGLVGTHLAAYRHGTTTEHTRMATQWQAGQLAAWQQAHLDAQARITASAAAATLAVIAGLLTSACASTPAAPPTPPLTTPPPAYCTTPCPPMPPTPERPYDTARQLQDWGADCRARQLTCIRAIQLAP